VIVHLFEGGFVPHAADLYIHDLFTHVIGLSFFPLDNIFRILINNATGLAWDKGGRASIDVNFIPFLKPSFSSGLSCNCDSVDHPQNTISQ